ncbi:MAG: hypothetical protein HXS41_12465 [Theionarchaea archaeon]|nr:hypothetical protein [Theionarchaea archaeon]
MLDPSFDIFKKGREIKGVLRDYLGLPLVVDGFVGTGRSAFTGAGVWLMGHLRRSLNR